VLYAAIPVAGALVALFTLEELINGWRQGFERPDAVEAEAAAASLPVT
jgi:TRAP-type C4-dicarboxylate transport system permease small subunit